MPLLSSLGRTRGGRVLRSVIAALVFFLPLASCFSEHADPVQPNTDESCEIPLDAIGNNRAIVVIRDFTFFPDTLRVRANTQVTWVNCERPTTENHTSTSDAGVWESGALLSGDTYARTFAQGGSFPYHCTPHPSMRGVVIVQ